MQTIQQVEDRAKANFLCSLCGYTFGVSPREISSQTRGSQEVAHARQIAMYLMNVTYGLSQSRVASIFQRDRSTVAHACHLIEDKRDEAEFDEVINQLEDAIRAAPLPKINVQKTFFLD